MQQLRRAAGLSVLLVAAGLWQTLQTALSLQVTTSSSRWIALFAVWAVLLIAAAALLIASYRPAGLRIAAGLAAFREARSLPAPVAYAAASLLAGLAPVFALMPLPDPLGELMGTFAWRALVFWLAVLAGTGLLSLADKTSGLDRLAGGTALAYAVVFRVAAFLPELSTDPFSLGWSEGSRYYYASLFLSERIYGFEVPPSVLHPTRYLMQSFPFLFGALPLWAHRFWQVLLWVGTNGAAAWALAQRFRGRGARTRTLLAAWAFLFLFQGPVWYHLVVMVGFVLWGVESTDFRRTALVVLIASLWAGISRINWVPFPAALAALLYFLEVPQRDRPWHSYLAPVIGWGVLGAAAGFGSQYAYAVLSGNPLEQFGSSFTSDLLWYRLFPSATYPLGVLPGIVLVSLPVLLAAWQVLRRQTHSLSGLGLVGVAGILAVFFVGGLVVSAKIGGGSNLHNLDGYIALLMVLGAVLVFAPEFRGTRIRTPLLALAVSVPIAFALSAGGPLEALDGEQTAAELTELRRLVEAAADEGGEVLFIAERQLLTFDLVDGGELVPDYEKVFLMEMAMAANENYLGRFAADLESGRFALVVSDIVRLNPQDREDDFGEENNAWDRYVNFPLLCYYQEIQTLDQAGVEILVPKAESECPEVDFLD